MITPTSSLEDFLVGSDKDPVTPSLDPPLNTLAGVSKSNAEKIRYCLDVKQAQDLNPEAGFERRSYNRICDRYSNILPWRCNSIEWSPFPIGLNRSFYYLNASPIPLPMTTYISAQGPLPQTVPHFLAYISLHKIRHVVTLTMPKEVHKGVLCDKCYPWWEADNFPITLPNETVINYLACRHIAKAGAESYVQRLYSSFIQHHFTFWHDSKAPDLNLFYQLLKKIPPNQGPILVHCSAGIGRSGTFIAAHSLINEALVHLHQGTAAHAIPVDIETRIFEMRRHRASMVQTNVQVQCIIEVLSLLGSRLSQTAHKTG